MICGEFTPPRSGCSRDRATPVAILRKSVGKPLKLNELGASSVGMIQQEPQSQSICGGLDDVRLGCLHITQLGG